MKPQIMYVVAVGVSLGGWVAQAAWAQASEEAQAFHMEEG